MKHLPLDDCCYFGLLQLTIFYLEYCGQPNTAVGCSTLGWPNITQKTTIQKYSVRIALEWIGKWLVEISGLSTSLLQVASLAPNSTWNNLK